MADTPYTLGNNPPLPADARHVDRLLHAATFTTAIELANAVKQVPQRLYNVIHNRSIQMQEPDYERTQWARETINEGW